ncbi:A/G-specific adenine glycosylase [Spectribacter hydrogenoxidans]|uniref:Adenine DNA glycosylase n=1 Tax=Spectribacter hydrogenoxidans TaxID=3075608 RepID=A0ABU3C370_9GAMM|nr:A/G-specific adenine glycosylase [Salinisphaera sp. W335]MDT0635794.1 A/G-specific adenine glycosylase [Salinisphaera sp. W335]
MTRAPRAGAGGGGQSPPPTEFARRLLAWFEHHGRHDLPWQNPRSGYRVWVSEIMLQQTQVATVVPYFRAFMARFPTVADLAAADSDAVMQHWAGLGYYARARNLHAAARQVVAEHGGELPADPAALQALPGIGRSTAGAIAAQAFGRRAAMLDGNAKRVLARLHAERGAPGESAWEKRLWAHAEHHTPHDRLADYTQAIMDLGATVCGRGQPACDRCPVTDLCAARSAGIEAEIPAPRKRRKRPVRRTRMLVLRREDDRLLLHRRPPAGIWGGLWALPELPEDAEPADYCRRQLGVEPLSAGEELTEVQHGFTHFELRIRPLALRVRDGAGIMDDDQQLAWHPRTRPPALPAPLARLIRQLPGDDPT